MSSPASGLWPNVPKNIFSKSKGGTLSPKHLERGGVEHPPPSLEGLREKIKCKCNAVSSQKTVNLVVYLCQIWRTLVSCCAVVGYFLYCRCNLLQSSNVMLLSFLETFKGFQRDAVLKVFFLYHRMDSLYS